MRALIWKRRTRWAYVLVPSHVHMVSGRFWAQVLAPDAVKSAPSHAKAMAAAHRALARATKETP